MPVSVMAAREAFDEALRSVLDCAVALRLAGRGAGADRAAIAAAESAALDLAARLLLEASPNLADADAGECLAAAADFAEWSGIKSPKFATEAERLRAFVTDLAAAISPNEVRAQERIAGAA